jgi:hypothetical protein
MKLTRLAGIALLIVAGAAGRPARADSEKTRQVVGGDVLYSVQASARTESEALSLAERRAVHYLSVECSVPPKEARVYRQQISRSGSLVEADIQIGVSIEDCEAARNAPPARKLSFANTVLLSAEMPAPAPASRWLAVPITYRFSQAQLQEHERAIDRKAREREAERRRLRDRI